MRYFYDDSLAAAWMAKHFGIKFEAIEDDPALVFEHESDWPYRSRYYLHHDSVGLLDPHEGDTVTAGGGQYYFLCGNSGIFGIPLQSLPQKVGPLGMKQLRIIQRHSIPFMWPQSEPE